MGPSQTDVANSTNRSEHTHTHTQYLPTGEHSSLNEPGQKKHLSNLVTETDADSETSILTLYGCDWSLLYLVSAHTSGEILHVTLVYDDNRTSVLYFTHFPSLSLSLNTMRHHKVRTL